jgi:hypothetical protein
MSTKIDHCGFEQLARFFQACKYTIDSAEKYCWDCYGRNAVIIDASRIGPRPQKDDPRATGFIAGAQIIMDSVTSTVFEISVCDYVSCKGKGSAYKWYNPQYSLFHDLEASRRGLAKETHQAWDKVDYKKTTANAVLGRITKLFAQSKPKPKRKPKKKLSAPGKFAKALKRKKTVRRR